MPSLSPSTTRRRFLTLSAGSAALARFAFPRPPQPPSAPPNFLFILIDDMGWRDLGVYGSTFYETPNIDRLARQSLRFTNAYAACPVCSPTRASILTGKYPARLGLTDFIPGRAHWPTAKLIPPSLPPGTPAERGDHCPGAQALGLRLCQHRQMAPGRTAVLPR